MQSRVPRPVPDRISGEPVPFFDLLKNRLDLRRAPFSDRGSRITVSCDDPAHGLSIHLAEPEAKSRYGLSGLVHSLVPLDGRGLPLPFTLTTWPHALELDTAVGPFRLAFVDPETVVWQLPAADSGLGFTAVCRSGEANDSGGSLRGDRPLSYSANAPLLRNEIRPNRDGTLRVTLVSEGRVDGGVTLQIGSDLPANVPFPSPTLSLRLAANSWLAWFDAAPPVLERFQEVYYYAWWVMRANLFSPRGYLTREGMVPSKRRYIGVWHWDAFFHALAYRHVDQTLAEDQILLLLDHQLENGMIPDVVRDDGLTVSDSGMAGCPLTKPPLMGWAALKLYESSGNRDFLNQVYQPLSRWNDWWFKECDGDGDGLAQYDHPCSSGLDDSPLWDGGMPVEAPDLNTYLCVQMQSLASIAAILGRFQEAKDWEKRAAALGCRISRHFYDGKAGVFWALRDHQRIPVLTPFNLLPLWTGRLTPRQAQRAVTHLTASAEFWTPYPVPTVSANDPSFDPERMWRGPTWVNGNYMLVEALQRSGHLLLPYELAKKTVEMVGRGEDIGEYYNPLTGEIPEGAARGFGWSAALFIDLLIRLSDGSFFLP